MKGIYQYIDLEEGKIVYIGKDSHIDSPYNRDYQHKVPSRFDHQQINTVLQNNPDRYKYEVVCQSETYSNIYLNCLEKGLIKTFNPIFNFTHGGDGRYGFKQSEETKNKIRQSLMGEKNHHYGKTFSEEHRRKLSESHKGKLTGENNGMFGKRGKLNPKYKNYARFVKDGHYNDKQRYGIMSDSKIIKISIDKDKLLNWFLKEHPLEIIKVED